MKLHYILTFLHFIVFLAVYTCFAVNVMPDYYYHDVMTSIISDITKTEYGNIALLIIFFGQQ